MTPPPTDFDRAMMQRCLDLACRARGQTAPNPLVGAVVVQAGEVVGEGYHPKAGEPHAEVFALRAAGEKTLGATVYVNLEPCNHYGRTPPCAEALIAGRVAKVVIGMADPHQVASGGIERLQKAGIEVVVGVEEVACRQLNEGFIQRVQHQRPLGILKYAMTLDGKIATTTGHSAWITGEKARRHVHQLRSSCEAVVVGGNTIRRDNPYLTSHSDHRPNPLRVVMSRHLELPLDSHVWDTQEASTLVVTEPGANPELQQQLQSKGVKVMVLETVTPAQVMKYLYEQGCLTVLWECGGKLAASAIAQGAIQKVLTFVAPKIIGGVNAPSPVGDLGFEQMTQALSLERVTWQMIEPDLLMTGYLKS
jgi:diaminohydroxyphosphoribosylaminopyrimidine deaminase/5-amino-6-(5-phosphoribosylamino)uracil reductase